MKFSDLKKGETYFRYERLFLEDREIYKLTRKQVTVLTPKTLEICNVTSKGELTSRSRQRIYNPATATVALHATPVDAKAALVNTITAQIKSAESKVKALTAELNEALLLEEP